MTKVYLVFKISVVSVLSDEIVSYLVMEVSLAKVFAGEVIFVGCI